MKNKFFNWTALIAVKIISFILALIMIALMLVTVNEIIMRYDDTGISPEVMLSNQSPGRHFFDRHMGNVHYHAMQLLYYGSEDAINEGRHLRWRDSGDGYSLSTPDGLYEYAWIDSSYELDSILGQNASATRLSAEQSAIHMQLNAFRSSERYLSDTEGLIYYMRRGNEAALGNDGTKANFMAQPVYLVMDSGSFFETSHDYSGGPNRTHYYGGSFPLPGSDDDITLYLAFTEDTVSRYRAAFLETREAYIFDFRVIAGTGVALIALLIILLMGAGRKFGKSGSFGETGESSGISRNGAISRAGEISGSVDTDISAEIRRPIDAATPKGGVYFAPIDKPFLDIGLAAVLAWAALMVYIAFMIGNTILNYRNIPAMNTLISITAIAIAAPALLWFLSLAKRIKAGRFWRHTLLYFVPSTFFRFVKQHVITLWAGFRLTGKVGIISFASFLIMLITGAAGISMRSRGSSIFFVFLIALFFTVIVAFFLMRYARRVHVLEQGVRRISGGSYEERISAGGGELGSIADSANNISAGISKAVEDRLKSERLKTELITNVSHDIRTPLTSIITYTDLLKSEGLDSEKAGEYLGILIQKSQRLKTLTDELFEAAKAVTGNIDVTLANLDLVSLVNQVLGELDSAVKSSGLDLRVDMPDSLMVMADGKLMWRVLENLMSNVFKYSYPGSRVYLSANPDGSYVRLELKNISAVELNIDPIELTDRFKRGDNSRTDGGSGLGLSIVQSFVAAQGGKFSISIDGDLFKASVWLAHH